MAVVINEFEVVPDATPQASQGSTDRGAGAEAAKQKEKPDLADVLRRLHERAERVRAY
jgi:hypothetical protein